MSEESGGVYACVRCDMLYDKAWGNDCPNCKAINQARRIAALEAKNRRLKQLLYECNETGGIESTAYMTDDDLGLLWPVD